MHRHATHGAPAIGICRSGQHELKTVCNEGFCKNIHQNRLHDAHDAAGSRHDRFRHAWGSVTGRDEFRHPSAFIRQVHGCVFIQYECAIGMEMQC